MGKQVCGVKLMSPGGREVAPSGDEKEDAGPGLLTDSALRIYSQKKSEYRTANYLYCGEIKSIFASGN